MQFYARLDFLSDDNQSESYAKENEDPLHLVRDSKKGDFASPQDIRFHSLFYKELEVFLVHENAIAALAGQFMENTMFDESGYEAIGGGATKSEALTELVRGDKWLLVEEFDDSPGVGSRSAESRDFPVYGFAEREDGPKGFDGGFSGFGDGYEKEAYPMPEIVGLAHLH